MKTSVRQLKALIRETIKEIATPGDHRYGDARGGGNRGYGRAIFKDFDDRLNDPDNQANDEMDSQGLGSPGGSYVSGAGAGAGAGGDDEVSTAIDAGMQDSGRSENEFLMIIDSQVTRGRTGVIKDTASGKEVTVQGSNVKGDLAGDLHWMWQGGNNRTGKERAEAVIECLMNPKYFFLEEEDITDDVLAEIGIRGKDSGNIYDIVEYFSAYQNGNIKEAKKRARILKRRRRSRL